LTKQEIKQILNQYGLGAKKKWGQNFLIDSNIQEKIVKAANIKPEDYVVEIGPGLGALTKHIVLRTNNVDLFEIDPGFSNLLELEYKSKVKNIFSQDILQAKLTYPNEITVLSNLPYYITTPVLFYLLENTQPIKQIVVMMQKEVAERLDASPRTKQYNALTLILKYLADVHLLFYVPRTAFYPVPDVDSAVVTIKPNRKFILDPKAKSFIAFLKTSFNQRRKTLINNLSSGYNLRKIDLEGIFKDRFDINTRAEELVLEDFVELFDRLTIEGLIG